MHDSRAMSHTKREFRKCVYLTLSELAEISL